MTEGRASTMPPPVRQIDPDATPEQVAAALLRPTGDTDGEAVLRAAKRLTDSAQSAAV